MKCPECGAVLIAVTVTEDYIDPSSPDGHGQKEYDRGECVKCDFVLDENEKADEQYNMDLTSEKKDNET